MLDGTIVQLGSYVISARLVGALMASSWPNPAAWRKAPTTSLSLRSTISERRSQQGRESLRNVRQTSFSPERVTTASLPALKKYVEGLDLISATGDNAWGRVALLEAVGLDSTFAMAWRRIAATYGVEQGAQARARTRSVRRFGSAIISATMNAC